MEAKHTKGPWFETVGFSDDVEITSSTRDGKAPICAMDVDYTGDIGVEQRANARLIATAPDAYDIIMAFIEACDDACLVESDHHQARFADILRGAFAYRAKATQSEGAR